MLDLLKEAQSRWQHNDFEGSLSFASQAVEDARRHHEDERVFDALIFRSYMKGVMNMIDEAAADLDEAWPLLKNDGISSRRFRWFRQQGILAKKKEELQASIDYYMQALEAAKAVGREDAQCVALNDLCEIYLKIGEYELAIDAIEQSLAIIRAGNSTRPDEEYDLLHYLGYLFVLKRQGQEALGVLLPCLAFQREHALEINVRDVLLTLAEAYLIEGDEPNALSALHEALEITTRFPSAIAEPSIYCMLAECALEHGETKQALEYAERAFQAQSSQSNERTERRILALLMACHAKVGDLDRAKWAFERSMDGLERAPRHERSNHYQYAAIYFEALGDATAALEATRGWIRESTNLLSNNAGSRLNLLHIERERHAAELAKLRALKAEEQLVLQATSLATQTELLTHFRDELRTIIQEAGDPLGAMRKIKEKLKELPSESVDWARFERDFTSVHPEFRAKLTERFPQLTKQEIKMCQLARLRLKTHEMARLLSLSERTIDGHRNSLRKKLGIKPEENLTKFLLEIK